MHDRNRMGVVAAGMVGFLLASGSWERDRVQAAALAQDLRGVASDDGHGPGSLTDSAGAFRQFLETYCITCHNERLKTGGLALDTLSLTLPSLNEHGEVWEKVVRKLRMEEMPPPGRRRPIADAYETHASWLEAALDAAALANPNAGRPALHRLNRTEYANAIRDLLALEVDVDSLLPPDEPAHGFDNVADTLGVSPLLLEQYMDAARKISRLAVAASPIPVTTHTYRVPTDRTQTYRFEEMPFGTRGGLSVQHHFPLDGEYRIRIRLLRDEVDVIRGLQETNEIELILDGARVALFSVGGEETKQYSEDLKPDVPFDEHLVVGVPVKAGLRTVTATFLKRPSVLREDVMRPFASDAVLIAALENDGGYAYVANVAVSGPSGATTVAETVAPRRLFTCRPAGPPDEGACARQILSPLARLAYRRPLIESDWDTILRFYEEGRQHGGFDAGIEMALRRILASPQFIFRFEDVENRPPGATGPQPLSGIELASRLSFFLWSSIPDDELLQAAERGALSNREELLRQMDRMLADPKSSALVSNFAGQWLFLRNLRSVRPNLRLFPDFDDNLRDAFQRETGLLFDSLIREDRSVLDLLDADYTFVNERLARHYGIPGVTGDHFRRVPVTDPDRRGLLGHGSILTVTSYETRTSPVTRGKWILDNLLGSPPPPPPPDVPDLSTPDPEAKILSMRERMVAHRANPQCATCHASMDPLGLALENFDAVGRWRTIDVGEGIDPASGGVRPVDGGTAIDTEGSLPNGTVFEGPAGLRNALLARPEEFVRTVASKLLVYALGRGLSHTDAPTVRAITRDAEGDGYRLNSLIAGIVMSVPFRMIQPEDGTTAVANGR